MSKSAQAILASHKEAASRAINYLRATRNLKLDKSEALELVARVLGVANWQTLHALAKQGKAPRDKEETLDEKATAVLSLMERAARLSMYYSRADGRGEHPRHLKENWANSDGDEGCIDADYWAWVVRMLDQEKALMPWERDALDDVRIARAAKIDIDFDPFSESWVVASAEDDRIFALPGCESERAAWAGAAEFALNALRNRLNMTNSMIASLSLAAKVTAIGELFPFAKPSSEYRTKEENDSLNQASVLSSHVPYHGNFIQSGKRLSEVFSAARKSWEKGLAPNTPSETAEDLVANLRLVHKLIDFDVETRRIVKIPDQILDKLADKGLVERRNGSVHCTEAGRKLIESVKKDKQ